MSDTKKKKSQQGTENAKPKVRKARIELFHFLNMFGIFVKNACNLFILFFSVLKRM